MEKRIIGEISIVARIESIVAIILFTIISVLIILFLGISSNDEMIITLKVLSLIFLLFLIMPAIIISFYVPKAPKTLIYSENELLYLYTGRKYEPVGPKDIVTVKKRKFYYRFSSLVYFYGNITIITESGITYTVKYIKNVDDVKLEIMKLIIGETNGNYRY